MPFLDQVLAHNDRFVEERTKPFGRSPAKRIAIFTCMDTRLVDFLEPAMGIKRGDAKIIKNAGTTVIDPRGGVIRSLVVAVHALGCEEIFVIGHLDCGMGQINEKQLERKMLASGVSKQAIAELHPSLHEWLGTFKDVYGNLRRVTKIIRENSLIPRSVPVYGLMFDPATGRLEVVVRDGKGKR